MKKQKRVDPSEETKKNMLWFFFKNTVPEILAEREQEKNKPTKA